MQDLSIGERLSLIRKRHKEKQHELASAIKFTDAAISRIERNITKPSPELLIAICKHYDISADWLLGIERRSE